MSNENLTQEEIDLKISQCSNDVWELNKRIMFLDMRMNNLRKQAIELVDYHALIPIKYKSVQEWAENNPFPKQCYEMVYQNKLKAGNAQCSSMTYLYNYHVVRCEFNEIIRS